MEQISNTADNAQHYFKIIASTFLFKNIDEIQIQKNILSLFEFHRYKKGETISSNSVKRLYIILSGSADVYKHSRGKDVILNRLTSGAPFGLASLFNDNEDIISVIKASDECVVADTGEENLRYILKSDFKICENYIRYLSERVCFLNSRIDSFIEPLPEIKLANFIESAAESTDSDKIYCNSKKLADVLNISRQTLYRAFESLESDEIIKKEYKYIIIKSRQKLRDYLNEKKGSKIK